VLKRYPRLAVLVIVAFAVVAAQTAYHTWDWYRHREERAQLTELRERVVDAGAAMVIEHMEAERLRATLEVDDLTLERKTRLVDSYSRYARGLELPAHLHGAYMQDREDLKTHILERNARLEELRSALARRSSAADLYQSLSDSLRALSLSAGDPFYPIPLPAEAAAERGVSPEHFN
jgi:Ni/Co efflux regulator RcnB